MHLLHQLHRPPPPRGSAHVGHALGEAVRVLGPGASVHVAAARLQLLERERDEELGRGELVLEHVVERRVRLELRVLLAQPVHVLAV